MKNVIFLYGESEFLLDKRFRAIRDAFVKKHGAENFVVFDPAGMRKIGPIQNELFASPFLGAKRLVAIRDPFAKKVPIDFRKVLVEVLPKIPDSSVLLVVAPNVDRRTTLFKKLVVAGTVEEFKKMKMVEVEKWTMQNAKNLAVEIASPAATRLVFFTGGDLRTIDLELKKLKTMVGGRRIEIEDIEIATPRTPEAEIFALVDAISARDRASAFSHLDRLFSAGKNEFYLLSMLAFAVRNLLVVVELREDSATPPHNLAAATGMHPFVASKTWHAAKNFTRQKLKVLHIGLRDLDRGFKLSEIPPRAGIEKWVIDATG